MSAGCWNEMVWDGRPAIRLEAAGYEAVLVPSLGANVIRLCYHGEGEELDILRSPATAQELLENPYAYGVPILFPANRISGGQYEWEGVRYTFPQNYPNGVHIHGVLHNRAWPLPACTAGEGEARALFTLKTDEDAALREHFSQPVSIRLELILNENGLLHRFSVENRGSAAFPVGLAYHTALRVPFCTGSGGVRLHVPLAARCTDDPIDRLPNGGHQPLDDFESRIATEQGAPPLEKRVDYLYTAKTPGGEAVLWDPHCSREVVYLAGAENRYWILWNQNAAEDFISVEPQTWLTNAMNRKDPALDGAIFVPPGETWSGDCRLYTRPATRH